MAKYNTSVRPTDKFLQPWIDEFLQKNNAKEWKEIIPQKRNQFINRTIPLIKKFLKETKGYVSRQELAKTLDVENDVLPSEFSLSKAYPNPFNPTVNIDIEIPQESEMEFFIYNLLGNQVFKHKESFKQAGKYRFRWNGLSNNGKQIPSGIYLIAMRYDSKIHTQKITFLK